MIQGGFTSAERLSTNSIHAQAEVKSLLVSAFGEREIRIGMKTIRFKETRKHYRADAIEEVFEESHCLKKPVE